MPKEQLEEIVRVMRIVIYEGPRFLVEENIKRANHGTRDCGSGLFITSRTINEFPEILQQHENSTGQEEL